MNIKKLDDETEFILDKFREGFNTMEIKQLVKDFIENNITQSQALIENKDFKSCYFIHKKMEKIISVSLKNFGNDLEYNLTCYKELMTNMLDTQKTISSNEKKTILKHPI